MARRIRVTGSCNGIYLRANLQVPERAIPGPHFDTFMSITFSRGTQLSSVPSLTMIHWSVMAANVPSTLLATVVESGQDTN